MKKIYNIALALCASIGALTSCSNDGIVADGEGQVNLVASLDNDVKVISRATGEDIDALTSDFRLYIYSSKGLIRKYHSQDELPTEGLWLISGDYEADLWAGDSTAASFTHKYFKGKQQFTISKGSTETVNVVGKIQNTVASVTFAEALAESLSDVKMTIGTTAGSLDFTMENAATSKGYYMLPEGTTALSWTLSGTMINGEAFSQTGKVENAKAATEYQFDVKYNPTTGGEVGGSAITVTVDETTIDVTENITLTAAPKISGSGFDISQPIFSSAANFATKVSVYVTAAAQLSNIVVKCDNTTLWEAATGIAGSSNVDLIAADVEALTQLKAAGLYMPKSTDPEGQGCGYNAEKDEDIQKIVISKNLLNNLANGTYNFSILATDVTGKSRAATLKIEISNAKVVNAEAAGVRQASATIVANIAEETATGFGFEYRVKGAADWIRTTDVTVNGTAYTYALTGLKGGTTYEYRAFCDDYTSPSIAEFTTVANFQLPNAGFEEWHTEDWPLPYAAGGSKFWDTGNGGAAKAGKVLTAAGSDYKHSGSYSAKMESTKASVMGIGKFAAGNIFIGSYLETIVAKMGGIIGFGQPFVQDDGPRPTALRGYVKYICGTVDNGGDKISKDSNDIGTIYIVMADETTFSYTSPNGSKTTYTGWSYYVDTTNSTYFDRNASNVMGYGAIEYSSSTEGDGLIPFEIPIEYTKDGMPKRIIIVAASSKFGDYFQGSTGSKMWLDDLELVYE